MPTKKTKTGVDYEVDGKKFTWHPESEDGERGTLPAIEIPLRLKLKVIRSMNDRDLDAGAMFDIVNAIVSGREDVLDEMDLNDFQQMFATWQDEYTALTGASLGESSGSSS